MRGRAARIRPRRRRKAGPRMRRPSGGGEVRYHSRAGNPGDDMVNKNAGRMQAGLSLLHSSCTSGAWGQAREAIRGMPSRDAPW